MHKPEPVHGLGARVGIARSGSRAQNHAHYQKDRIKLPFGPKGRSFWIDLTTWSIVPDFDTIVA